MGMIETRMADSTSQKPAIVLRTNAECRNSRAAPATTRAVIPTPRPAFAQPFEAAAMSDLLIASTRLERAPIPTNSMKPTNATVPTPRRTPKTVKLSSSCWVAAFAPSAALGWLGMEGGVEGCSGAIERHLLAPPPRVCP